MLTKEYLGSNAYPGRLIIAGMTPSGKPVYAYAIMGRSPNSRNRVFQVCDGQVQTAPFDVSKVKDPSLIIYPAILKTCNKTIVANGDQSLNIRSAIEAGKGLAEGISERTYEPDEPNWTPRISLVLDGHHMTFGINRRALDGSCERPVWEYDMKPGLVCAIHTYKCDGNPLPSFEGEPVELECTDDYAQVIWDSLDAENRISLYVCEGGKETVFNAREMEK